VIAYGIIYGQNNTASVRNAEMKNTTVMGGRYGVLASTHAEEDAGHRQ
jgi:DNA gyrase inhibitor GyrI